MSQTQNKFAIHEAAREGNASVVESLLSVRDLHHVLEPCLNCPEN